MQITRCVVTPIGIKLKTPVRLPDLPELRILTAIFVRLETRDRRSAWGVGVAGELLTGESAAHALAACRACADLVPDLHPTNLEFSLAELTSLTKDSRAAACAFDLAFYDLLGLETGLPLYRLLGGYRQRIETSITIPISNVDETVTVAESRARQGFRHMKVKGGSDPESDVQRIKALHRHLPNHTLRLDADGGYTTAQAIEVARALRNELEMLEQPTPADDLSALREVTKNSPVPVLADQSICGPESALQALAGHCVDGVCIKVGACGGLNSARQVEAIARAAQAVTMVSCLIEPALLTAAGLSLALSSPNVRFGDLDGYMDLIDDPTQAGFHLEDGWLIASEVPGLGCTVDVG